MIRNLWQELKKFPIVLLFLAFLFCFSILDALWPKREFSELENRKLMQPPKLTLAGVLSKDDPWMAKYTEYTKDQFIFRDGWIDLKSRAEAMLLKTENNGIWFGKPRGWMLRDIVDAVIYAAITAGVFAWLWPAGGAVVVPGLPAS